MPRTTPYAHPPRVFSSSSISCVLLAVLGLPVSAADNVAGNLINFNNDGDWSWYMDERAISDPLPGTLLIGSAANSSVLYPTGRAFGQDEVSAYNLSTGVRSQFQLTPASEMSVDDHDAPGLFLLPDGRYIAMYSNHGNTAMGDYLSRYRISTNPHDAPSWSA